MNRHTDCRMQRYGRLPGAHSAMHRSRLPHHLPLPDLPPRPLAKRITTVKKTHTNSDRNIGKTAVVITDIDNIKAVGQVKVGYSVWSAKSADDTVITKDTKVIVKAIEGAKLIVEAQK